MPWKKLFADTQLLNKKDQSLNINGYCKLIRRHPAFMRNSGFTVSGDLNFVIWLGSLWVSLLGKPQCVFFLICKSRLFHKEVSKSSLVHGRKPKETMVRWCAFLCLLLLFCKGREVLKSTAAERCGHVGVLIGSEVLRDISRHDGLHCCTGALFLESCGLEFRLRPLSWSRLKLTASDKQCTRCTFPCLLGIC